MDNKKIGQFIAMQRKQLSITQQNLAEKLDITNKAVSKWETGEGYPDITVLPALAEVLEVSVDEILKGEKNDPSVNIGSPYNIKESKQQAEYILGKSIRHFNNNYLMSIGILCIGIIASSLGLRLYRGLLASDLIYSVIISLSFLVIGFMFYNNICKGIKTDIKKYNSLIDEKKIEFYKIIHGKHVLFYAIYAIQVVILVYIIPIYPYRNIGYYFVYKKLFGFDNSEVRRFWVDYDFYIALGLTFYFVLFVIGVLVITMTINRRKTKQYSEENL